MQQAAVILSSVCKVIVRIHDVSLCADTEIQIHVQHPLLEIQIYTVSGKNGPLNKML